LADQKAPQMHATWPHRADQQRHALIAPARFSGSLSIFKPPRNDFSVHWVCIVLALLLCWQCSPYAEISRLYPGTGSSYYYAEAGAAVEDKAFKYARVAKFIVGWGFASLLLGLSRLMVATRAFLSATLSAFFTQP